MKRITGESSRSEVPKSSAGKIPHIYNMDQTVDTGILNAIRIDWPLMLPEKCTEEQLLEVLSVEVNRLINHDFARLIALLYRIDINETRLKKLLAENKGSNAGRIIAWMILERQKEKQRSRKLFSGKQEMIFRMMKNGRNSSQSTGY